MRKKVISIFLVLILILGLTFTFVACDKNNDKPVSSSVNVPKDEGEYDPTVESKGLTYIYDRYLDGYSIYKYEGIEKDVVAPKQYKGKNIVGIESKAFENTSIRSLYIPSTVKYIISDAFYGCNYLERLYFDDFDFYYNIETSSMYSFMNSKIKDVYVGGNNLFNINIPSEFSDASKYALYNIPHRKNISVAENNEKYYVKDNCLITKETNSLVLIGDNTKTLPDCIERIDCMAFNKCDVQKSFIIPSKVKHIDYGQMPSEFDNKIIVGPSIESINIIGYYDYHTIYFYGTLEQIPNNLKENFGNYVIYYSENKPSDTSHRYWHFVDGLATIWSR